MSTPAPDSAGPGDHPQVPTGAETLLGGRTWVTKADQRLAVELARRGVEPPSSDQLQRWRDRGLLGGPQRATGLGAAQPSERYSDRDVDRAEGIVRALAMGVPKGRNKVAREAGRVNLVDVPMWLFLLGYDIDIAEVRASFNTAQESFMHKMVRMIARETAGEPPEEAAEAFVADAPARSTRSFLFKALKHRSGIRRLQAPDYVHSEATTRTRREGWRKASIGTRTLVLDAVQSVMAGPLGVAAGISHRALSYAVSAITFIEDATLVDEIISSIAWFRFDTLTNELESLTDTDLVQARDDCRNVAEWLRLLVALAPEAVASSLTVDWFRKTFHPDAHYFMIMVIVWARIKRSRPWISQRVLEELNDARAEYRERETRLDS